MVQKNPCLKMRPADHPYEVWQARDWQWWVLKKNQISDDKPFAIWHCLVYTPMCPEGEYGDTYVKDIKSNATCIDKNPSPGRAPPKFP